MWMAWGPRAHDLLQRRLLARHPARQAPVGARPAGARGVGRDLGRHRPADRVACSTTGQATWDEDLLLFLERSGYPEETYHTFSYSPLGDDDGRVVGHAVRGHREHRPGAVGERRMATLRDLATAAGRGAHRGRSADRRRRPAGDATRTTCRSASSTSTTTTAAPGWCARVGIDAGAPAAPVAIAPTDADHGWPAQRLRAGHTELVEDLAERFAELPVGRLDAVADRGRGDGAGGCARREPGRGLPGRRAQPVPPASTSATAGSSS